MTDDDLSDLVRQVTALEAKYATQATSRSDALPRPGPATRRDRQAYLRIALVCKRALGTPPFTCPHDIYLLEIARLCKRMLEPDGRDT